MPKRKTRPVTELFGVPRFRDSPKTHIKAENRQIADAQLNNSSYSSEVPGFSPATEWVRAKTTDETLAIKNNAIVKDPSLQPAKIYSSMPRNFSEMKTGVLLINLGTPDAPDSGAVRRYLKQFLSDERVLDINSFGRWLLLNFIILPFRSRRSAKAYRKVWTPEGSPLLVYGQQLTEGVRQKLQELGTPVVLGMRYGNPSVGSAIEFLRKEGCDRILVLPLFPQYASSSTGSAVEEAYREASRHWNTPHLQLLEPFYDDERFIEAFAAVGRPYWEQQPDHVIFSFHGLPERHVQKSDYTGEYCLKQPNCCATLCDANRMCYGAHCHRTATRLAEKLGIPQEKYSISYQSRLGRTPWLRPYTDQVIAEMPKRGIKKLVIFCPAFVADCLETLEEIGMEAVEEFKEAGGEDLQLVPSLNSHPQWVEGVASLLREKL